MDAQHTKHVTYKLAYPFVWCPKYAKSAGRITGFRHLLYVSPKQERHTRFAL